MSDDLQKLTAKVVSAFVANNSVALGELPALIQDVYRSLATVESAPSSEAQLTPAVPVKKSIRPDAVICLDCGKAMQMLKRHLVTAHGLSINDYRAKWNLGADYPVVAPNYASVRSAMAKKIGLGQKSKSRRPKRKTGA